MNIPRNVWLIATSFFFVFFGFGTAQQYLIILFNQQGRGHLALISLVVLYTTFLITGIFVSKLIPWIGGLKRSLMIGASTYVFFVASVAVNSTPLLLFAAFLIGIGAGLLWVSSGQIIVDSADAADSGRNLALQSIGMYSGNIFGIYTGRFLATTVALSQMYMILAAATLMGLLFIFFIHPLKEEVRPRPFKPLFIFDRRMLAVFPIIFGAYFLLGQVFTAMNLIIVAILGIGAIPLFVTCIKLSNIAGSFGSGSLSKYMSKRLLLTILILIAILGTAVFTSAHALMPVLAGALLLGFSMAAMYPVTLSYLKETMPEDEFLYTLGTFHVYTNVGALSAIATNLLLPAGASFIPGTIALMIAIPILWMYTVQSSQPSQTEA